jgi:hypothetical protein
VHYLRPYPVEYFDEAFAPGEPIAIAGMGLVGYDLVTALTIGRGGEYKDEGDRKRYVPGREPEGSTSTHGRAFPTARSRRTGSIRPAITSRSCARPRPFER